MQLSEHNARVIVPLVFLTAPMNTHGYNDGSQYTAPSDMAPLTPSDTQDIQKNKAFAALGYVSIFCLVPLTFARQSQFAQFHGKQGLVLFLAAVVVGIVEQMLPILWPMLALCNLAILVLSVMGIIKAIEGKYWEMPILGDLAKKLTF